VVDYATSKQTRTVEIRIDDDDFVTR